MVIEKQELAPGIVVYKNVIPNSESLVWDIEEPVSMGTINWSQAYVCLLYTSDAADE